MQILPDQDPQKLAAATGDKYASRKSRGCVMQTLVDLCELRQLLHSSLS